MYRNNSVLIVSRMHLILLKDLSRPQLPISHILTPNTQDHPTQHSPGQVVCRILSPVRAAMHGGRSLICDAVPDI